MPTIKRREWAPCPLPDDLKPDEEVFELKMTGEVFREYKVFVEKMNDYRANQWSCKFTGKSGLTFSEALLEEQRSTDLLKEVSAITGGTPTGSPH